MFLVLIFVFITEYFDTLVLLLPLKVKSTSSTSAHTVASSLSWYSDMRLLVTSPHPPPYGEELHHTHTERHFHSDTHFYTMHRRVWVHWCGLFETLVLLFPFPPSFPPISLCSTKINLFLLLMDWPALIQGTEMSETYLMCKRWMNINCFTQTFHIKCLPLLLEYWTAYYKA